MTPLRHPEGGSLPAPEGSAVPLDSSAARGPGTTCLAAAAVTLLLAASGGCGGGRSCPFGLVERIPFYPGLVVACCGASASADFHVSPDDAEIDLAYSKPAGPAAPVHAWITTASCSRLFDGEYPPAGGSPRPLCTTYLGPVAPGEVSPRQKVSPGTYRLWVQAFSSSPEPHNATVDVGVWGERCGGPRL